MSDNLKQTVQSNSEKKAEFLLGSGRRPKFHALWHLVQLGIVDDTVNFASRAWEAVRNSIDNEDEKPVRVAVIDTMPAFTHPNLVEAIDKEAFRDFSDPDNPKTYDELPDPKSQNMVFGAHGTAVAGLIAAKPLNPVKLQEPQDYVGEKGADSSFDDDLPSPVDIALPYCGINPFAKIVPLVVSAAPDPQMIKEVLEHAIEMAKNDQIDIVVIADSWDRNGTPYLNAMAVGSTSGLRVDYGSEIKKNPKKKDTLQPTQEWKDVDEKLNRLSRSAFVFCAAGNEPRTDQAQSGPLVYPASLSTPDSGPWAVGACDFEGRDLTYTPDSVKARKAGHRLITTLSSEHPRFDNESQRLDLWAKVDKELDMPLWLFNQGWPAQDIVSTDVPGPAGYNPSPYDHVPAEKNERHLEVASLFCRFSGTSAATAIAAGLVALALALERAAEEEEAPSDSPYKGPGDEKKLFRLEEAKTLVRMKLPRASQLSDR